MGPDGPLDTDISERKALGWMISALFDEVWIIDVFYETIIDIGRAHRTYSWVFD